MLTVSSTKKFELNMRRARIKAVANVPLRRKATQDASQPEPSQPSSPKVEGTDKVAAAADIEKPIIPIIAEESDSANVESQTPLSVKEDQETTFTPVNEQNENNDINKLSEESTILSPESTFAALASPPYRSESIKSDSASIKSPASPSKLLQNRSRFVRPVPRLDGSGRIRRNSIQGSGASASESEDDGRRPISAVPNRIRNDSCCSVQSNRDPIVNSNVNNVPEFRPLPKRRMVISESARKLAEARREFLHKHGKKTPDRNKLTMYDLIYYNPVTNPMKNPDTSTPAMRMEPVSMSNDDIEHTEEENVDEPAAMPVPQVKVGPDGQLIIDEQSLVIEQTGTKKGREALANSEVVVDEGRTGNGFYKRPKKSKEWPKWETLRFYKALNTIGTDFLLMQSLFPNRSRQEIKLKFKKEEKTNRPLVEKALKYHQEFDTDALQEELAIFAEKEKLELEEKNKAKENKTKDKERSKTKKRKKCAFVTSSIGQDEETEEEEVDEVEDQNSVAGELVKSETNNNLSIEKSKTRKKHKKNVSIEEALDDLMQGAGIFSDSESETEIYEVKPTRSGRCPKIRRLQAPDINKMDDHHSDDILNEDENITEECVTPEIEKSELISDASVKEGETMEDPSEHVEHKIPDISKAEPGSLVILSSESPDEPGKTMLQVYMVSPNPDPTMVSSKQNIPPIELSPELLATVTTKISKNDPPNVDAQQSVNTT
ncbi:transcription factor TFIIIB component B'' homolog isoform X1 [Neodiprion pinetum]|uniref:transcription factor TFIIIB component B'' homolog isoform X1 n=2 Tax=Neodiprion pinetum TaxID=441929 RepID=UPI001EDD013C|nr:transcription factor TFIIIB component B'' homolog isoform X1 [Neodiprion pinetum]